MTQVCYRFDANTRDRFDDSANDGGVVATLFFMVCALWYAMFSALAYYDKSQNSSDKSLPRLLSGWANIGNCVIHLLLVLYMHANAESKSLYWVQERKLGGIEGPVFLAVVNGLSGVSALKNWTMRFPLAWNCFAVIAGTFVPIVWPRFISEGLVCWPYMAIFIWFAIFAMELTAFTASLTHCLTRNSTPKEKDA